MLNLASNEDSQFEPSLGFMIFAHRIAVMVTANLPAFAAQGTRIDVTVSALQVAVTVALALILESVAGIQEGVNPRVLEQMLMTYLPESQRQGDDIAMSGLHGGLLG